MRTAAMCFSFLQVPRCRIYTFTDSSKSIVPWIEAANILRTRGIRSSFEVLGSSDCGLEGEHNRRLIRPPPLPTKTAKRNKNSLSSKTCSDRYQALDVTVSTKNKLHINEPEISDFKRIQYCDIQQKIAERDLVKLTTIIVFDIETTGFSRDNERIIEIALQDLLGGENSTFQTLVNPERYVPNPHVHGISTHMVSRPGVPRMKDLIPILLKYVKSRRKPGGLVLLIAHNARCFDVPFLVKEFSRCSFEVPPDWLFVDTLPLAREVMKSGGSKSPFKTSLQALREHYEIRSDGTAHRAMSDVRSLVSVLERMTYDLKLPVSDLIERSFRASDLIKLKKKRNSG